MKTLILITLLTWTCVSATLKEDFQDFLKVIPLNKIRDITLKYMNSDAEFQAFVQYLQSPEWQSLVEEVQLKPEVQAFDEYLMNAGLDSQELLSLFEEFFAEAKPTTMSTFRGLKNYFDEIARELPLGKLLVLLNDKLNNSPEFIAFFEVLSSEETRDLLDSVRVLPEVQMLEEKLLEIGVDVTESLGLLYGLLGWN